MTETETLAQRPDIISMQLQLTELQTENVRLKKMIGFTAAVQTSKRLVYNAVQRNFACKMKHCSGSAYKFLRTKLPLPSPRTIRLWMSEYNAEPGFTEQSISELANRLKSNWWQYTVCSLMVDEMDIKKHIDLPVAGNAVVGFTTDLPGTLVNTCRLLPPAYVHTRILCIWMFSMRTADVFVLDLSFADIVRTPDVCVACI